MKKWEVQKVNDLYRQIDDLTEEVAELKADNRRLRDDLKMVRDTPDHSWALDEIANDLKEIKSLLKKPAAKRATTSKKPAAKKR